MTYIVIYSRSIKELLLFFSSRRRHTRSVCDWSSDVCSSDLITYGSRATSGAIEAVVINDDDIDLDVIGNSAPR